MFVHVNIELKIGITQDLSVQIVFKHCWEGTRIDIIWVYICKSLEIAQKIMIVCPYMQWHTYYIMSLDQAQLCDPPALSLRCQTDHPLAQLCDPLLSLGCGRPPSAYDVHLSFFGPTLWPPGPQLMMSDWPPLLEYSFFFSSNPLEKWQCSGMYYSRKLV